MAYDEVLAERLRERLPAAARRRMFGGLAFLTGGNMTVGVYRDDLLVRLSPEDADAALDRPGVRPFDMTGRPMRGWVLVAGEHLDDADLDRWVATASAFVATLPPK
ncbi:TfoX/Sxy family protein [Dactylosporangium sp. NPDC000244]|uniref:TfoX/Sxy family protein n=1 Tax=Dactylosporangium sp. NPDC000244 TaxID=3154365 RepID=UPI00332EFE1F